MCANEIADVQIATRTEQLREGTSLSDQEAAIQAYRENGYDPSDIADELEISRSQVSVAFNRISQKQQEAQEMSAAMSGQAQRSDHRNGGLLPEDARPSNSPQIFLAPCVNDHAQHHFQDTVLDKVDVEHDRYREHVPSRYHGRVSIWGTGEGNQSTAEAMEPGDVILFYVGENTYSHYAVVQQVQRNSELAEVLWTPYGDTIRKDETENWPWVMYLGDPVEVDIDSTVLHDTLGWSQSYPLGFTRVADHRVAQLKAEHGSVQQYLEEVLVQHAAQGQGGIPTIDMSVETTSADDSEIDPDENEPSLEELREQAEAKAQETTTKTTSTTTRYERSNAVRKYVLALADGVCEACGNPAPFEKPDGQPYLETHHVYRVSDEGMDDPAAVAAICPTCHRRIHHGDDGSEYNKQLIETLRKKRSDD